MLDTPPNVTAHRLLEGCLAEPGVESLEALLLWLLEASPIAQGSEIPRTRRLALLAEVLRGHPRSAELLEQLRAVWTHGSTIRLLAETGLPVHATLMKEAVKRLADRLIPRLEPDDDLYVLLSRLGLREEDAAWVEGLSPEALAPWRGLVALPGPALMDAARLMAKRTAAVGLARDLLELQPGQAETASPFFKLGWVVDSLAAAPADEAPWQGWRQCYADCRDTMAHALARLETRGVSTDLIFRLELLEAQLFRLDDLLEVGTGRGDGRSLASDLIRGSIRQRGIRSLARTALKRLARQVVEHTGETGEHYLVSTRRDWEVIGLSASWGGVVAGLTAATKFAVTAVPLPPMLMGLAVSLNYGISFVAMQLLGFTLASRQPAMTAAALADALEHRDDTEHQVELVAGITRSQVVATLGNVLVALPVGLVVVALWYLVTGSAPVSLVTAAYAMKAVHPLLSLAVPFAAVTGVLLWLSSLSSGWAGNAIAYRGLSEAIARHRRMRLLLGAERAARIGQLVDRHLSAVLGYLVLGFLMGFVPVLFSLVGIPLTVPHVSLNSGAFAIGVGTLLGRPEPLPWNDIAWGLVGILLIGTMNIAVSFALALRTAIRARDLGRAERSRLWRAIRSAFRAQPSRFLWRTSA